MFPPAAPEAFLQNLSMLRHWTSYFLATTFAPKRSGVAFDVLLSSAWWFGVFAGSVAFYKHADFVPASLRVSHAEGRRSGLL